MLNTWYISFQSVPHVEYLIHLLPVGLAFFLDNAEQGWHVEHVVLDDVHLIGEMQHLGLGTAAAMHHAMNMGPVIF